MRQYQRQGGRTALCRGGRRWPGRRSGVAVVVADQDSVGLRRDCVGAGHGGGRAVCGDDRDGVAAGALAGLTVAATSECVCGVAKRTHGFCQT
jgi:hypothetical protein